MLGYRKRPFIQAHSLLQKLRGDQSNLAVLKELQILLLQEVMRAEKQIRSLKVALKPLVMNKSAARAKASTKRIEALRDTIFIWKCFGDAIAFIYLDKYALKHTFYSTEYFKPKNEAGFLFGKEGLPNELAVMFSALEHNVPTMLCDLTNTIRHGDICMMGESDPYLVEVKSSKGLDRRGRKQRKNLEILREFYETDRSSRLRGMAVTRESQTIPEWDYAAELNTCIADALEHGIGTCLPEPGLHYIVLRTRDAKVDEALAAVKLEAPLMYMMNAERRDRTWAPYYPFTLTINDRDHLWAFLRGDVYIIVLVGTKYLESIAKDLGFEAVFDINGGSYPLTVTFGPEEKMQFSEYLLARIGFDCVSPSWLIRESIERFRLLSAAHAKEFRTWAPSEPNDPIIDEKSGSDKIEVRQSPLYTIVVPSKLN
ncbi:MULTISPECIES: hypothetical protein [unclassified Mesorhizobium]|uniref:hypothetical protein n=1 Tax=unclassified Mesorhizobium TaxID=325217 RepID=UPI001125C6AB|nr:MULTISPECIES: hypothetical protein [unclassified Mesorhizobium]MBZ9703257.1 hypothetical protein [Mesorhizobium sp. CO1-1-3]MBZ9947108.1 hypothetical protein [Mesorhizobium sp. BR1-1-11]TPJ06669.1 hypothetical protein FJ428_10665 [Mesorhizobium sp. B2-8-1]